jgi:hypothetical protein
LGGPAEMQFLRHDDETAELAEVHDLLLII